MSYAPNPFQSPGHVTPAPLSGPLSFGQIVNRGFSAAHGAPIGAAWMFALMAPIQLMQAIMYFVMMNSEFFDQLQSGDFDTSSGFPPAFMALIGFGCFSCFWLLVMLFAAPWIWGGTLGQLRERVLGQEITSFAAYGRKFYFALLLLMVILFVLTIVVSIPNAIVPQIIATTLDIPAGQPNSVEEIKRLQHHPLMIASAWLTGFAQLAMGTIINMIGTAVVFRGRGFVDGFGQGISFCFRNFGSVLKLYLILLLLLIPLLVFALIAQVLTNTAFRIFVSLAMAAGMSYLFLVSLGLQGSLFAARQPDIEQQPELAT